MKCLILTQNPDKPEKNLIRDLCRLYSVTLISNEHVGSTDCLYIQADVKSRFDLRPYLKLDGKFDVTICFNSRMIFAGVLMKLFGKTNKLLAYRGTTSKLDFGSWLSFKNPLLDLIISNCKAVKDSLIHDGVPENKIRVIYKGHDEQWYAENEEDEKGDFVTVMNYRKSKGFEQTWEFVKKFFPESSLTVFGDFPEKIVSMYESKNLIFKGFKVDCYKYLSNYKVFILLSSQEGIPKAAVEASFKGLPLVLSPVGGIPEIWSESAVFVGKTVSKESVDYIKELISNDILRQTLAEKAKKSCLEKLNFKDFVNNFIDILTGINGKV